MENQPTTLDKAVKISIIAAVLIVALSVAYYLVIFLPQKEKMQIEQEKQVQDFEKQKEKEANDKAEAEKNKNAVSLSMCISLAKSEFTNVWTANCKDNAKRIASGIAMCREGGLGDSDCRSIWGSADSSSSCSLPMDLAKSIEDSLRQQKDECFKKYPQK